MSHFVCQMRLTSVMPQEHFEYGADHTSTNTSVKRRRGVRVHFAGNKGEPFGSATPDAQCEMAIANSAVADLLIQRFLAFLGEQDTATPFPLYRVTFEPINEDGSHAASK